MIEYRVPTVEEIKATAADSPRFTVVSLFAGGGGSSTGYRMAGGKVLAVSEFIEEAQETYRKNWPDTTIYPQDIRNLSGEEILSDLGLHRGDLDILDGSPPCSAFSTCGRREKLWGKDKKYSDKHQSSVETLFFEYTRILSDLQPRACIAENVSGLAKGASRGFCNEIIRAFRDAGYIVQGRLVDAAYLGVPQHRKRLIFVGIRKDLWRNEFADILFPRPFTYIIPLSVAFSGVVNTASDLKDADCSGYAIYRRLKTLREGEQDSRYFNLVKLSRNKPSRTITAKAGDTSAASICHWDNRKLTVNEVRRITSLPDDYILTGSYSQKIERMGRMVPPLMMRAISENLYSNVLSRM